MSVRAPMTVEESERLPEDESVWREPAEGELIEAPGPVMIDDFMRDKTTKLLGTHLDEHPGQGFALAAEYFRLSENDLRKPDVAPVGRGRFPLIDGEGVQPFAPKLAAKFGSPTSPLRDKNRKIQRHFKAGVPTVWIFMTNLQQIRVHPAGHHPTILMANDMLEHPTLLRGFSVRVAELFEIPR